MNYNSKTSWSQALAVIDKIESSMSVDEIFTHSQTYVRSIGCTSLVIGRLVNPIISGQKISAFGRSDWPEEWADRFVEDNLVIHDPISQYALKSKSTFNWETAKQHGSKFGQCILEKGHDYNLRQGIAIPITAGHLPLGLVSVSYDEEIPPTLLARLEIVAIHAYTKMLDFLDDVKLLKIVNLTKREVDILTFTAAGKTSWEISKIYGIADSTVKKHLQNIIFKTDAANKTHAVTKAFNEGLIIP